MAAFSSCRRSACVRLLVVILCALFIFATLAAPPAQALGVESVALFGLASVLSAATAALGFKLASNEQGQVTLQKMVQDFKTVAWATGFVLVGSKLNGLKNGMDYIKMQVQNGKTYLDARVFAWVQQWLAVNGVYDSSVNGDYIGKDFNFPITPTPAPFNAVYSGLLTLGYSQDFLNKFSVIVDHYSLSSAFSNSYVYFLIDNYNITIDVYSGFDFSKTINDLYFEYGYYYFYNIKNLPYHHYTYNVRTNDFSESNFDGSNRYYIWGYKDFYSSQAMYSNIAFSVTESANNTGLSGTDTLGKDVVDLTLDQVLEKLKEWTQDWFDAGADSATNAATGALDLPLTVATGAATANPSIAEDGPLVWFPPFSVPIPNLRTGETDTKTVDQGKENASAVETSTVDVAENQSVIDSLVNWALSYISPNTGLFSKFPLCVPYDAYLLVTSSLGVDAVGSDSIFGASPGDLEGVVSQDIETYSDFQPIINIKHDFELDGKTYPVELTIDLTPWQPFVTFFREGMALLLVAELIGSEFKRIRGH